jgi:hypothetical protein
LLDPNAKPGSRRAFCFSAAAGGGAAIAYGGICADNILPATIGPVSEAIAGRKSKDEQKAERAWHAGFDRITIGERTGGGSDG